jgi:hypothetical protein
MPQEKKRKVDASENRTDTPSERAESLRNGWATKPQQAYCKNARSQHRTV